MGAKPTRTATRPDALYAASTLEIAVDRLLESSNPRAVATTLKLLASSSERLDDEFEDHRVEPTR
jgi:hypothetical protein